MSYKYQEIDIERWCEITKEGEVGVFGSKEFLLTTAEVYKYNFLFCLVTYNGNSILTVPLFTHKSKVTFPNHYFYQFVWQNEWEKESWSVLDAWDVLLKQLQSKYTEIKIRLPISVTDSRPFIWNNFDINIKYTYIKTLVDLCYHQNIKRIVKKEKVEYTFKKNCDWDENWKFHNEDLNSFGVRVIHKSSYMKYFKGLKDSGLVQVFNAYHNNVFLSSILVIIDRRLKTAYFPLIGTADGHYKSGLPAMLYNYTLTELKSEGFETVDLVGANIRNIAKYKSKFLPTLFPFFEVSYSKRAVFAKTKILKIKKIIGKILFWVK